jgi:hypothetical protein
LLLGWQLGDVDEDVHTLARHSLLVRNTKSGLYETSRLVQTAIKCRFADVGLDVLVESYTRAMHSIFNSDNWENRELWQDLFPHAEILLEHGRPADPPLLKWADVLHGASWYARQTGRHTIADIMLKEVIIIKTQCLGPKDPSTLASMEAHTECSREVSNMSHHNADKGKAREDTEWTEWSQYDGYEERTRWRDGTKISYDWL